MEEPSGTTTRQAPGCRSASFNFPGWKNHPELRLNVPPSKPDVSPVSTSPDGRTIRNRDPSIGIPRPDEFQLPRMEEPSGTALNQADGTFFLKFQLPRMEEPSGTGSGEPHPVTVHVSTSPDGRTIRNARARFQLVDQRTRFQLPRMEEPSGTPASGTPAPQGLSRRIARSPSAGAICYPTNGVRTAQIPCAARQRAAPRKH